MQQYSFTGSWLENLSTAYHRKVLLIFFLSCHWSLIQTFMWSSLSNQRTFWGTIQMCCFSSYRKVIGIGVNITFKIWYPPIKINRHHRSSKEKMVIKWITRFQDWTLCVGWCSYPGAVDHTGNLQLGLWSYTQICFKLTLPVHFAEYKPLRKTPATRIGPRHWRCFTGRQYARRQSKKELNYWESEWKRWNRFLREERKKVKMRKGKDR